MALTPQKAELVGASIAFVLYGVYLVMCPATLYVLRSRDKSSKDARRVNVLLLLGNVLLFCFITASWIVIQLQIWTAFIDDENKFMGPLRPPGILGDPRLVLLAVLLLLEAVTVDLLLLYRVYVLWNKAWRIVLLPLLTLIAATGTSVLACVDFATAQPYADLWKLKLSTELYAAYSLNLMTNILAIVLIWVRIMHHNRSLRGIATSNLNAIVLILIESAALYCLCILMIMGGIIAHSNLFFLAFIITAPVTGISFCLIILRVGLGDILGRISTANNSSGYPLNNGGAYPMLVCIKRDQDFVVTE